MLLSTFGGVHHRLRQFLGPRAALSVPVALDGGSGPGLQRDVPDRLQLLGAVCAEAVDGYDAGQSEAGDDADVVGQVGAAPDYPLNIGLVQVAARHPSVPLERPGRGNQDSSAGK